MGSARRVHSFCRDLPFIPEKRLVIIRDIYPKHKPPKEIVDTVVTWHSVLHVDSSGRLQIGNIILQVQLASSLRKLAQPQSFAPSASQQPPIERRDGALYCSFQQ